MLFAHKDHGFTHLTAAEGEALAKDGWEPCADPMEFKRRAWGMGAPAETPAGEVPEEAPKQKRKWTRRAE